MSTASYQTLLGLFQGKSETSPQFSTWEKYSSELQASDLSKLNDELATKVFLGPNNRLSDADLVVFSAAHSVVDGLNASQRVQFANVTRWFDNIQHLSETSGVRDLFPLIPISRNAASHDSEKSDKPVASQAPAKKVAEKRVEEVKKVEEAKKIEEQPKAVEEKPKQQKREQQPKKQQQPKKAAAPKANEPEIPDIAHLDIRVGKIVDVKRHPDADKLYVEQIDLGEAEPRTIVSGLVNFVPIDQMNGRMVVVLCNLKPRDTRGVVSAGMVLCASNKEHTAVEPLDPPAGAKAGDKIFFEGFTGYEPDQVLNPKKKYFEKVQPDFTITSGLIAVWKDKEFLTSSGPVTTKSLVGATIA